MFNAFVCHFTRQLIGFFPLSSHCPSPISLPSFAELLLSIGSSVRSVRAYQSIEYSLVLTADLRSPINDRPFCLPGDHHSVLRAASHIRKTTQGRRKKREDTRSQGWSCRNPMETAANIDFLWLDAGDTGRQATRTTISVLPDNVLLEIFCFYKDDDSQTHTVWKWHLLVHVCRGWRQVVFASPLRLDLRIFCTSLSPVRTNLGIWPPLPICVDFNYFSNRRYLNDDNIVTALEYADRVCDVSLNVTGSEMEKISTVMREPFPVLTSLRILSEDHGMTPVLPVEFLGGSAPRLQSIFLDGIPFPALPTLLLTTGDLFCLDLRNIPRTGYVSPEEMVVGLAALPRLNTFVIEFQSASPRPNLIHRPRATRTVLPALTEFTFKGASEYLEDLVARIDAPHLDRVSISYLNQLVDFQVAQLPLFIDRSVGPQLTSFRHARITFGNHSVTLCRHANYPSPDSHYAETKVLCHGIDWQVSHIAQVISHFSETLSNVVHLMLKFGDIQSEGIEGVDWLPIIHQFSTVQTLHVAGHVALALEHIAWETLTDTLPSLDLIYLEGRSASSIEKFVAARQLSGRPVTVLVTEGDFYERVKSHVSE